MKKKLYIISLALIPLLTVIVSTYYRSLENPILNFDPNYLYFCNIVSTADFKPIGVPYHPGTSLLLNGAIISKVVYTIRYLVPNFAHLSFAEDTLLHPEIYIDVIKTTINYITYFLLFFAGIFTWRISKSLLAGIFIQLTPIIEPYLFLNCIGILEPILLLLPGFILLGICIISAVNNNDDSKKIKTNAIFFGIIISFLVASRLNAAPVAIIPLIIIPKIKNKLIFIGSAALSGLVFLSPIWSCYKQYFARMVGMLSHSGRYGTNKEVFFNSDAIIANFKWVLNDKILVFSLIIAAVILFHFAILKILRKKCNNTNQTRALAAVVIAQLFVIISILRHRNHLTGYSEIWFFPCQLLISIILTLIVLNINVLFASKLWLKRIVQCLFIGIMISAFGKYQAKGIVRRYWLTTTGSGVSPEEVSKLHCKINTKLNNDFLDYTKITYHTYYSIPHNLLLGDTFAQRMNSANLLKLYPDYYWYNKDLKQFSWWTGSALTFDKIYDQNPKIVFQGTAFEKLNHNIGLPLVKVLDSNRDVLYVLKTEYHFDKINKALDSNEKYNKSGYIIRGLDAIKENERIGINIDRNFTNKFSKELVLFINALKQKDDLPALCKTITKFRELVNDKNQIIYNYILRNIAPKSWQKEFKISRDYCVVNIEKIKIFKANPIAVQVYNLPKLNEPRTIKLRVKPYKLTGTLISYGKKEREAQCAIAFNPNKNLFFWGFYCDIHSKAKLPLSKWSDICLTYDGKILKIYLNSEKICERELELKTAESDNIIIGEGFWGEISDIEIWNEILPMDNNQKKQSDNLKNKSKNNLENSDWTIINK